MKWRKLQIDISYLQKNNQKNNYDYDRKMTRKINKNNTSVFYWYNIFVFADALAGNLSNAMEDAFASLGGTADDESYDFDVAFK